MGLNNTHLDDINTDADNFEYDDPEIIIFVRLMDWYNQYKPHKTCTKR